MAALALAVILLAALYVTVTRGIGAALVWVYLPVTLLVSLIPGIPIPMMPNLEARSAVVYGVTLGFLLRGAEELTRLKWHPIDFLVIALASGPVITGFSTGELYTAVTTVSEQYFGFVFPYLLARMSFHDPVVRRQALYVVVSCVCVIGFFAFVEMRLWPYFYSRYLKEMGLSKAMNTMTLGRFGLFRAQVSFDHPIDLGNGGVLLGCLIVALAKTVGMTLRTRWVLAGLAGCAVMTISSMSFTSYAAGMVAVAAFAGLWFGGRLAASLIVPGVIVAGLLGVALLGQLLVHDLSERPPQEEELAASYHIRALIAQNAWAFVETAGFFGYGRTIAKSQIELDSVDNAYLLIIMRYGWVYFMLWVAMLLTFCTSATFVLLRVRHESQRIPILAGVCGVLSVAAAMFTVWFGFVYAVLFTLLLGLSVSMIQVLRGVESPAAAHAGKGFAVTTSGGPARPTRLARA